MNIIPGLWRIAITLVTVAVAPFTRAQWNPTQPLRIVIPGSPGSIPDIHARKVAETLAHSLGQPVIIDNRPGANGIIGATAVAMAKPDGYTIGLLGLRNLTINPAVHRNLPYDPKRDFALITRTVRGPPLLLVNPQLPVRTVAELIAYAKTSPRSTVRRQPGCRLDPASDDGSIRNDRQRSPRACAIQERVRRVGGPFGRTHPTRRSNTRRLLCPK